MAEQITIYKTLTIDKKLIAPLVIFAILMLCIGGLIGTKIGYAESKKAYTEAIEDMQTKLNECHGIGTNQIIPDTENIENNNENG